MLQLEQIRFVSDLKHFKHIYLVHRFSLTLLPIHNLQVRTSRVEITLLTHCNVFQFISSFIEFSLGTRNSHEISPSAMYSIA